MVKSSKVDSKLETKASENLQKQVEAELNQPDPSPEKAKAVLDGDDEDYQKGWLTIDSEVLGFTIEENAVLVEIGNKEDA